jgi:uncharacterized protein YqeY
MSIKERLEADMKEAMRSRETRRLTCIRMLRAKLLEREVELRAKHGRNYALTDAEAEETIATYAKQRRDSIEAYAQAGREELAANEREELSIVTGYLPEPLGEAELREIVKQAVSASKAASVADIGAVMKLVMPQVKGRADGKLVNRVVREALG